MSRPKELNFFVEELNWSLGPAGTASQFDPGAPSAARPRRTTPTARASRASPSGCASVIPHANVIYMVRDPIDRMLSHYLHNVGGGYEERTLEEALRALGHRVRRPKPLRVPARAVPRCVRPRAGAGGLPRGAEDDRRARDARALRVRRRRPRLHLRGVRPRVGDGRRQVRAAGSG